MKLISVVRSFKQNIRGIQNSCVYEGRSYTKNTSTLYVVFSSLHIFDPVIKILNIRSEKVPSNKIFSFTRQKTISLIILKLFTLCEYPSSLCVHLSVHTGCFYLIITLDSML